MPKMEEYMFVFAQLAEDMYLLEDLLAKSALI